MEIENRILTEKRLSTMEEKIDNITKTVDKVSCTLEKMDAKIETLDSKYSGKWVEKAIVAIGTALTIAAAGGLVNYFINN
jgi:archaellum component FlaC